MTPYQLSPNELAGELIKAADSFSHNDRMKWALANGLSLYTVNNYLKGKIGSIIVARQLLEHINGTAAALPPAA